MIYLLAFITALLISLGTIPVVMKISKVKFLFDTPDFRKHHKEATPTMGGIGILVALFVSLLLFADINFLSQYKLILSGLLLLSITGIADDLVEVSAKFRLMLQAFVGVLVYISGFAITSDYGLFGIGLLPNYVSFIVTVFSTILFINAFNFIDGINGLAGGYALLASIVMMPIFYLSGNTNAFIVSVVISGSLLGFLNYNYGRAKIFMGDSGSLLLGALLIIQSISFLNNAYFDLNMTNALPLAFAIIALPAIDIVRVVLVRMINKKSPFSPDRTHIHHILVDNGFTHETATFVLLCLSLSFVLITLLGAMLNTYLLIVMIMAMYFITVITFSNKTTFKYIDIIDRLIQTKFTSFALKARVFTSFFM